MNQTRHLSILKSSVFVLSALASSITLANENSQKNNTDDVEAITLESVVVTGSRRAVKSALDAPAPVDIITPQALLNTGEFDLSKALAKISPSVTLPTSPAGGFGAAVAPGIALRGLTSDQTLILINGKRRHTSAYFTRQNYAGGRGAAGADLSLIPISAVERIEILRDGAAAQFGSDAIAGVVNIILKTRDSGANLTYQGGGFTQGDGEQHKILGWKGLALPNDGSLTLAFDAGRRGSSNNTLADNRKFYNNLSNPNHKYDENNTPYRNWKFGAPELKDQFNLSFNADLPLTETASLYGFGTYGHRKTRGENFYEPPSSTSAINKSPYFQEIYPDGRIPVSVISVDDFAVTVGGKSGTQKTGKIDAFATYGHNKVHSQQENGFNPSYGVRSPTEYSLGNNLFSQLNTGVDYSRDFNTSWLFSPLTISTGALYRWEEYKQQAGNPVAYTRGSFYDPVKAPNIYAGITDQDVRSIHRDVYGAYLDLEADIVKDLNAGVALRSEHYSDFGSTTNGKLTLKYNIDPQFSIRGSASTGYRAPSLAQLGYSTYSVQTVQGTDGIWRDVQQRTLVAGSEAAQLVGGKKLKSEKSTNYSFGFVWEPLAKTAFTLDIYQINIKDRILLSDNISGSLVTNAFAGTAYSNINNVAFFNNLLDTRTRGLEFTAKHDLDLNDYGNLKLNLGFALNDNKITKARDAVTSKGDVISSALIAGRNTRSLIESAAPKNKLTIGTIWDKNEWSVSSNLRRHDKWTILNNTNTFLDQTFSPQWVLDLDVGYKADQFVKGLKLNVGAVNLFNSHPDRTKSQDPYGVVKYSFNAPEGSFGTYVYGRVSYDF
ncbi:TonB-dependent receptor [Acinetobacter sp. ANC 4558]|uniref:TonB-dependent receptor plug domain-containing protein n=1 Tax=Acinetobacter sp. ANC 4558 TaxID=1977876 RepID=UPI000A33852B|nr:TonB-dependent receptor [Acinetobacter sp. ANC 4558]OTG84149.1 TonB-dependent receptor [Acinetobacter sp. ANC 4558]